jgi:hypothetical protein
MIGVGLLGADVALRVQGRSEQFQKQVREEDRQIEEKKGQPKIEYVAVRYANGETILTFRNPSSVTVAVSQLTYTISDGPTLERIQRKYPKPTRFSAESPNDCDSVVFTRGYWIPEGTYAFDLGVGIHIDPGEVSDIALAIADPEWAGEQFIGTVSVDFSSAAPAHVMSNYVLSKVTIEAKHRR